MAEEVEGLRDLPVEAAPAALRAKASFSKTHVRRMMGTFPLTDEQQTGEEGTSEGESRDQKPEQLKREERLD